MEVNHWTDSEGVKRQSINIVVQSMQLLDNVKPKELQENADKITVDEHLAQMREMLVCDEVSLF